MKPNARLQEERYSDAVVRLGDLLSGDAEQLADEDLDGQDFFLDVDDLRSDGKPVTESLMRSARDQNRRSYPLQAQWKRINCDMDRWLANCCNRRPSGRDWHRLREVRRRYFHTDAGLEASVLLLAQAADVQTDDPLCRIAVA